MKIGAKQTRRGKRTTTRVVWLILPLWALLMFVAPLFAATLNQVRFLGYPLGFYMAAQGTSIVLVALAFWFCRRQDRLERAAAREQA